MFLPRGGKGSRPENDNVPPHTDGPSVGGCRTVSSRHETWTVFGHTLPNTGRLYVGSPVVVPKIKTL